MLAALTCLVLGGAAAGAGLLLPRLHARAAARAAEAAPRVVVDWPRAAGAADTWMDETSRHELLTLVHDELDRHPDPLRRDQLEAVGRALRRTGWFAQGPVVERGPGGVIRVGGKWRVRAAVVRSGGSDHLVAWGGELLPRSWPAGRSGMPVVTGVQFDPPRSGDPPGALAYGEVWPGQDVQAGLELLALLQREPFWGQVEGVDVSSSGAGPGRERLVILTRAGTRVVFGARASDSGVEFGEVTTERKLWNLRQVYARYGRIDAGRNELLVHAELVIVEEAPAVGHASAPR